MGGSSRPDLRVFLILLGLLLMLALAFDISRHDSAVRRFMTPEFRNPTAGQQIRDEAVSRVRRRQ